MRNIMVVNREVLFAKKYFDGFITADEFDFESIILDNFTWMNKNKAETNQAFKQPIGYSIIYNPELKQVFMYQRSKIDKNYAEKRLQGKWSCGVGGHVENVDTMNGNPIHESSLREILEEVTIPGRKDMRVLGFINDDTDEVGRVHFGILYLVITNSAIVTPLDPEIDFGKLVNLNVLEEKCQFESSTVENWTKTALQPLKLL
jgi:predicted NUDIX family phosphoesterase